MQGERGQRAVRSGPRRHGDQGRRRRQGGGVPVQPRQEGVPLRGDAEGAQARAVCRQVRGHRARWQGPRDGEEGQREDRGPGPHLGASARGEEVTDGRQPEEQELHRSGHPGPRGPGARAQAPRHVHRRDRRDRVPPPVVGDRRQLRRRGDQRLRPTGGGHAPQGRADHHRRRRWSRHPGGRDAEVQEAGGGDHPHHAARRREVRARELRALGRPARRRLVGGERAGAQARARDQARRQAVRAVVRARQGDHEPQGRGALPRDPAPRSPSSPTRRSSARS